MPAAAIERTVGSMVAGKYRLIRVLGRGGMGVVYEAEHTMTRRRVAVKVLHAHHKESSDAARRFINEAQAAGRIQHPNVVEVLDAGEEPDGSLYLVLELLAGQDLATQLMRVRRLEVADTVTVIAQVLQALVVAHRQGIIHRDIKPENIFLTRSVTGDTHVKILDFGISKAIGGDQAFAPSVTQTNTTVGTPHYMSPEQARGERTIDTRADLWAVGVVMYECLAGNVPFDGETYNDQIVRVITEPHEPLVEHDVPDEISRIVDRALEKDRNRRYALAAHMLADIRQFIERHPEYASVPMHYLREPQPVRTPPPPAFAASTNSPTIDTANDPAFDPSLPPSSDTVPSVPGAASLFDSANEDMPTTVKLSPSEESSPGKLLPLAGVRTPMLPPPASQPSLSAPTPFQSSPVAAEPASDRRNLLAIGAVLLVASVVIGTVAAMALRRPAPVAAPVAVSTVSNTVAVRFVGAPPGALISVAGVPARGEIATVTRGSLALPVTVSAPGYSPMQFTLVPDRDQTVPLMLPLATAPAAPPPVIVAPRAIAPASAPHAIAPRPATGTVTVHGTGCTIAIDGQIRGRTPINHLLVPTGSHLVICRTPTGAIRSRPVVVGIGVESTVEFD